MLLAFRVLVVGVISFVIGLFPTLMAQESGARAVFFAGLITAVIMSLIGGWFGSIDAEMAGYSMPSAAAVMTGLFGAGLAFSPALYIMTTGHSAAAHLRATAPVVAHVGLERFDALDANGDGIIIEAEIRQALRRVRLSAEEEGAVKLMHSQLSSVGHVIGTVLVPIGETISYQNVYGVSKDDLRTYSQRVAERWRNW